ncbi:hypothetical protein VHEMI08878 [[Torrubiella] hemipterigena]|uniref:Uncharacterized protein n=1 Tax=[Torrubiella] hemipterigena TaxID=1531966 RepID=A0A0A1TEV9_9HYPO|nr:hypothetical protein VHEMI08878 [[Torrubiella] hemipterigena]
MQYPEHSNQEYGNNSYITDAGGRPSILKYPTKPEYIVGDDVYLINDSGFREGPYTISSVISASKYTLSQVNGTPIRNGDAIDAESIEKK